MNKTILVPYDFSEASEYGVKYAIDFASSRPGMDLRFCLIADTEDPERFSKGEKKITAQISRAFQGKLTWTHLVPGSVKGLLEKCVEDEVDMVIMGTAGSNVENANTKTAEMILRDEFPVQVFPSETVEDFKLYRIAQLLGHNEIDEPKLLHT